MKASPLTIVLIGAGNVGNHLGRRLLEKGFSVVQIFSRSEEKASFTGKSLGIDYTHEWAKIYHGATLYIIAVKDDVIGEVAGELVKVVGKEAFVVHTSGSVPMHILAPYFHHYGSFYPLQTFSKNRQPDFDQIPICIAANGGEEYNLLESVATQVSQKAYSVNDQQRAVLHIAAVMANNFTNHLYSLAAAILADQQLPFDLLKPLILETATKVQDNAPSNAQTGPAIRGDAEVIEKHLVYLKAHHPEMAIIYELLTGSIQNNTIP